MFACHARISMKVCKLQMSKNCNSYRDLRPLDIGSRVRVTDFMYRYVFTSTCLFLSDYVCLVEQKKMLNKVDKIRDLSIS